MKIVCRNCVYFEKVDDPTQILPTYYEYECITTKHTIAFPDVDFCVKFKPIT